MILPYWNLRDDGGVRLDSPKPYVVFDIDGTLANIKHRLHHIKGEKKDWDAFNSMLSGDELNADVAEIYYRFCDLRAINPCPAIVVTGRFEKYRAETEVWLAKHGIKPQYLFMRQDGDYRSDDIVKEDIYNTRLKQANIVFVVDDRERVVKMWRKVGLRCLQVQDGDY